VTAPRWTAGPWRVIDGRSIGQRQDGAPARLVIERRDSGYKSFIAECWGSPAPAHGGTLEGNTALIAAAPALYAACESALSLLMDPEGDEFTANSLEIVLRAALALANPNLENTK
jgi:hypothetical protein